MPDKTIPTTFSVDFITEPVKISDLISTVQVRIYYKGGNRNGSWITDVFAEKLNATLPHIPIVGSYNKETGDFEDHSDNGQKRAYGFIPNDAQLHWESNNGKSYLVATAYLWTGYWEEAAKIVNKSQSMELNPESINGEWKVIAGDYYFVFESGSFKGLCTLGDTVVPCFEEAAFFALDEESRSFYNSLNKINEKKDGGIKMPEESNVEFTATPEVIEVVVVPTVEVTPEEDFEKVTTTEEISVIRSTESDDGFKAEETMHETRTSTVEYPDPEPAQGDNSEEYTAETFAAKEQEIANLQSQIAEFEIKVSALNEQIATLSVYKDASIKNEKLAIIETFKRKLSDEEVSPFVEGLDRYTTQELRAELAIVFADKALNETIETVPASNKFIRTQSDTEKDGVASLLKKYQKK
jgi:hypothetical protein